MDTIGGSERSLQIFLLSNRINIGRTPAAAVESFSSPNAGSTMIAYAASDLIWDARIKKTAEQLGLPILPVRSIEALRGRLADSALTAVIVDLDQPEQAIEMIRLVRKQEQKLHPERGIHLLAFGPHVAADLFQRARDAGADEVLPRGAFSRSLPDILRRLEATG